MILDIFIILVYFAVVMIGGFWAQRRAGKNMESYFLGNHRLPWWALAMSGSASNFSLMGTMWMYTVLFVMGIEPCSHRAHAQEAEVLTGERVTLRTGMAEHIRLAPAGG